ncbi:GNAT family N-acetyltransferase [Streptomyces orinoci]|uniref:GNAT family protein n=1 Tax=Streptomyces orinoci TaxID=67339 RepID=A0ABV3K068_STRON|nr:GNAT family protein [Streptomyces orinoci]
MTSIEWPIRTDRLLLRPFVPEDTDDVWAYQRQPEVARYMRWDPRDREQSRASVEQMAGENRLAGEGDCLSLAVVTPEDGRVVGQVELVWLSRADRQGEIGCVFNPAHQGKGLATEAVRAVLGLGFGELGLHRVIGRCHAHNGSSARLLERLGMRREAHFIGTGLFKGGWRDDFVYAMLRREWLARG